MAYSKFLSPLALLALILSTFNLNAQNSTGFKSKYREKQAVDASHLNPRVINGADHSNFRKSTASPIKSNVFAFPDTSKAGSQFRSNDNIQITLSEETQLPIFVKVERNETSFRQGEINVNTRQQCFEFLNELSSVLKIENPQDNFEIRKVTSNDKGSQVRLIQKYNGLEVYGAEIIVHLNAYGEGDVFTGKYHQLGKTIDTNAVLTGMEALQKVTDHLKVKTKIKQLSESEKKLVKYPEPEIKLVVFEEKSLVTSLVIAYEVSICPNLLENYTYFVNAKSGKIIQFISNTCHVDGPRTATATDLNGVTRTINTYEETGVFHLADASQPMFNQTAQTGAILTYDAQNTSGQNLNFSIVSSINNIWNNPTAVSAHSNALIAYQYFLNHHNRNSIDGNGGNIISMINVADPHGQSMENATWNGAFISYGNGGSKFKPLAGALDVAGHEMSHGVIQHTANLVYEGESGALNESISDIFGCMMDSEDWLIGEDIVRLGAFPSGAMRSFSDPHNGGGAGYQPKHMSEKYYGTDDNGGVHINSGIPNYAFYLFATAISKEKAAQVFYKALTCYLTRSSRFIDLRLAVVAAAGDLYGVNSFEQIKAGEAFDAVGIYQGAGTVITASLPVNRGSEYMLTYDTFDGDFYTLYRSNILGQQATVISNTELNSKPSVSDDGSAAVFVSKDNRLVAMDLTSLNFDELLIDDNPVWHNVAISKDGNKIAAILDTQDTSVYVFDLIGNTWARFLIYNPTYTEGVTTGGPVFIDALEWDYSGQYLIYDAYNTVTNSSGENLEFWDVGSLKVWDIDARTFGDGEISKLFNNLPKGVSIGNPSFSKCSPGIIAFDYYNEINDSYAVLGYDIENNDLNIITENNTLGHPSYSKDDAQLAFGTIDSGIEVVALIDLHEDKISASTNAIGSLDYAKWPVIYAQGARPIITALQNKFKESKNVSIAAYPNPFDNYINLKSEEAISSVEMFDVTGKFIYLMDGINSSRSFVSINTANLKNGMYILKVKTTMGSNVINVFK